MKGGKTMTTLSTAKQAIDIDSLLDKIHKTRKPVKIQGTNHTGVLISDEEWRGIQETLHLKSIPGMWESIIESANAPDSEFIDADSVMWDV
jgi:PHD/YefM family antitoxin component YafN of YafNO toxin-antitoxin module